MTRFTVAFPLLVAAVVLGWLVLKRFFGMAYNMGSVRREYTFASVIR